ncbi:MAG: OadG family protein [Chloroflexi bacterium]|nr:OadG family protein [Chloroflexota bacterium]MBP8059223.1 OadG family protein [Chloroflexota bacterium]
MSVENILIALQITLIGMGLVLVMIMLLWGMIAILVRLTTQATAAPLTPIVTGVNSTEVTPTDWLERDAAAVAVTIALALDQQEKPHVPPLPATALVSAWQAVLRTTMLNKRGNVR